MSMPLSIVVVSWRARDLLHRCLTSIRRHAGGAEIVVIDNAADEKTAALLSRSHPGVRLLVPRRNLGFGGGCNRGIAATRGEAVLLLNPDAEALAGSVQRLVEVLAAHPRSGAVGGLLVDGAGRPQRRYAPQRLPSTLDLARWVLAPGARRGHLPAGGGPRRVEQVAGACMLLRRSAWEAVGGFDESFWPVWFEDMDLCRRLWAAGWAVWHHPGSPFRHQGGGSVRHMDARSYYSAWYRNLHRYCRKHHGLAAAALVRALTVPGAGARLAATMLPGGGGRHGRTRRAAAYMNVASRSLTGWPNASQSTS